MNAIGTLAMGTSIHSSADTRIGHVCDSDETAQAKRKFSLAARGGILATHTQTASGITYVFRILTKMWENT